MGNQRVRLSLGVSALLSAAVSGMPVAGAAPIQLTQRAIDLSKRCIVIDGHNDLPWALRAAGDRDLMRTNLNQDLSRQFHTDIPRLRQGAVGAQFWSVYVPVEAEDQGRAFSMTLEQIGVVERMISKYPETFALATSTGTIRDARAAGKIASMIGVEGGHSIENSLDKLRQLYQRGARYMTLTHSRNTPWADSATDIESHGGLTEFGKSVVTEMNRLGMIVDISHVSAKTMRDALATSTAPVMASHSSAFELTNHPRNVPDDVLQLVARNNGIVMVNFWNRYVQQGSATVDADTVINHIEHIIQVAGIDHVGLGSDFDGVPELPTQLGGVGQFPVITQGLMNRGYSDGDICKVLGDNLMRVFEDVEHVARP